MTRVTRLVPRAPPRKIIPVFRTFVYKNYTSLLYLLKKQLTLKSCWKGCLRLRRNKFEISLVENHIFISRSGLFMVTLKCQTFKNCIECVDLLTKPKKLLRKSWLFWKTPEILYWPLGSYIRIVWKKPSRMKIARNCSNFKKINYKIYHESFVTLNLGDWIAMGIQKNNGSMAGSDIYICKRLGNQMKLVSAFAAQNG